VVEAAIETVRPLAAARELSLEYKPSATPIHIAGDADRLQQVVWNLLTNAVKFTPEGGRLQVVVERLGAEAVIHVIDNGQGIPEQFLPYVFDRFRQADSSSTRSHGGLGIGLTIVQHIVRLHGGSVRVQSAGKDRGSTFTVTLPVIMALKEADPAPAAEPSANLSALPIRGDGELSGVQVLLVDDELDAREVIARLLEKAQASVSAAASVAEALTAFQNRRPDVLITDLAMPHRDGYELIRLIRQLPPHQGGAIPAVALSAYARDEDRDRAIAAGFQVHLAKPVAPNELIETVIRLASSGTSHRRNGDASQLAHAH
jgi:CheY-like chemotaxis protein